MIKIGILDSNNNYINASVGEDRCRLLLKHTYQQGDKIVIEIPKVNEFYRLLIDDTLGEALVYMTETLFVYHIPFAKDKVCYSPRAFLGDKHYITVEKVGIHELPLTYNLAKNVYDQKNMTGYYPHASATVETRGEAAFEARNAIDGLIANDNHGEWPYSSWGINRDKEAKWRLDFGRKVNVNEIIVYERADFPHDNYWTSITIRFSNNETRECHLVKTEKGQSFLFDSIETEWIILESLIQSEEESPFPALTQIEVY